MLIDISSPIHIFNHIHTTDNVDRYNYGHIILYHQVVRRASYHHHIHSKVFAYYRTPLVSKVKYYILLGYSNWSVNFQRLITIIFQKS